MNKFKIFSILIILPVLLFITAKSLRNSEGPFYFNAGYDPNYVYAVSSLNIINSVHVSHTDHPGSTVQLIGAGLMLLSGKSVSEITESVLLNPESYLNLFNTVLILLNSLCLLLCGLVIYHVTKNLILTLIIQLSPFLSQTLIHEFTQTNPEIFIMPMMMLFIAVLFSYREYIINSDKFSLKYPLMFGILSGVCLATKITFLPLMIIPLFILKGSRSKMIFFTTSVLSFITITYPVMGSYEHFLNFIGNLSTHDGLYGRGEKIIFNFDTIYKNFESLIIHDMFFVLILIIGILLFIYYKFKRTDYSKIFTIDQNILLSLLVTFIFQIFIVSKHYSQHYLVPALMLTSFAVIIICINFKEIGLTNYFKFTNKIYNHILLICITVSIFNLYIVFNDSTEYSSETQSLINIMDNGNDNQFVFNSYGTSDSNYGMMFSMNWAGEMKEHYTSVLKSKSSNNFNVDFWNSEITYYENFENIKINLANSPDIFLRLKCFDFNKNAVSDFKKNIIQITGNERYNFSELKRNKSGESVYRFSVK
ncbi:MAG TPA: glycosyltransferase 87 family protein [Ignavibacteria bacterium]|nr:glycosyltransferase 87 family protein [Ignavibacteria bacterium]HQY53588.1 glycosyltransferase 87 family protein [Ignavibacteria bacterium]